MALRFKIFICIFLLASCSSLKGKKEKFDKIFELLSSMNVDAENIKISYDEIKDINYPLIQIKTNDVIKHAVLLPISERNNITNYISGTKQTITLDGAVITKTHGFNSYLISLEMKENKHLTNNTRRPNRIVGEYSGGNLRLTMV